jgi:NhaP-type Na+/H+ or K+/H+ antiporter
LPLTIADRRGVVPGVGLAEALVPAIVLACTDAALGQAVVSDERVPSRVRQGLNVESGPNDGLCVPLFFIAIAIAEADAGTASSQSAFQLVFDQILSLASALLAAGVANALGGSLFIAAFTGVFCWERCDATLAVT